MRFRRQHLSRADPIAVLWRELEPWFRDEFAHAGPDLDFAGLGPTDVETAWQFVASKADPLDSSQTTWDEVDGREVSVVSLLANGAVYAATRSSGLLVNLRNVDAADERLPWLGVFLDPDGFRLYWWLDDREWEPQTVAALAVLLSDLRRLLPAARIALEGGGDDEFWDAIDGYVATRTSG